MDKKVSEAFKEDYTNENMEQVLQLRDKVLLAEQERIDGAKTMDVLEARKGLRERTGEK